MNKREALEMLKKFQDEANSFGQETSFAIYKNGKMVAKENTPEAAYEKAEKVGAESIEAYAPGYYLSGDEPVFGHVYLGNVMLRFLYKEENKMLTKEEFKNQIIEGIKAGHGHLDPCNGEGFGDEYTYLPLYYWTVEDGQVVEELPFLTDAKFRFGISVADVENYTKKDFSESSGPSDDEIKQAMLNIVDDYGVDDWYDQYQQSLEMED